LGSSGDSEVWLNKGVSADGGSERTCIVTRTKGAPETMIRFVLGPDRRVVPDLRHKLPGRGVWVTARAEKVAEAVRRKAFARGFKAEVIVPANLAAETDELLAKTCLQALSLANKAAQIVTGFAKVEAAIERGKVLGLIEAQDAAAGGSRKLRQALKRRFGSSPGVPEVKLFTSVQLSLALGLANVIHAALVEGAAAKALLSHCRKLEYYRSDGPSLGDAADGGGSAGIRLSFPLGSDFPDDTAPGPQDPVFPGFKA
jgi:uncharacterized protein